jgi:hypothetical protein
MKLGEFRHDDALAGIVTSFLQQVRKSADRIHLGNAQSAEKTLRGRSRCPQYMRSLITARAVLTIFAVVLTGVLIPIIAFAVQRQYPAARNRSPLFLSLRIAAALTLALMIYQHVAGAPGNLNDDHRLAPSAALLHGYPAYYPPEQGPALSTIYGPVTAWTYLPAVAFLHTPSSAVRVGGAINLLMYYLPAIFLLWVASRTSPSQNWMDFAVVFFVLTTFNDSLNTASGILHADAPAIGWGVVSCALLALCIQTGRGWYVAAAGLAMALSVLAKQVMVPELPVLALYVLIVCGWRLFAVYAVSAIGFTVALLEIAAASMGGWQALIYNIVYIPTHQPFRREQLIPAVSLLANQGAGFAITAIAALSIYLMSSKRKSPRELLVANPSFLLLAVGLALCTTSILGKIKVVGSINTISPSVYFFLAAAVVELQRMTGFSIDLGKMSAIRHSVAGAIMTVFVAVELPIALYSVTVPATSDSMATVYAFSQEHPGEVYFPQFPLSVLLGENHLYHFAWGLSDRAEAGKPVSGPYFHQYIPPNAKVAAMVEWVWNDEIFRYLGREVQRPDISGLPGFKFYEIRDRPSAPGEPTSLPPAHSVGEIE